MDEYKILLKQYPYVKLYSVVPSQGSHGKTIVYAQDLPKGAKYHVDITLFPTHISRRHLETKYRKSMFSCIRVSTYDSYGVRVGFRGDSSSSSDFPSLLDCDRCEFVCKRGRLSSPVDYCLFLGYGCSACGFEYDGFYKFGSPCERCGGSVVSLTRGNPHVHGKYWVFQLHILNHEVAVTLGEFLGVEFDNQLRFSCKGSWHNFRNDSSGFDICHLNCLNDLLETRIKKNLKGIELFMNNFPEEGKVLLGNNKFVKCWIDGEVLSPSDYFARKGLGVPVVKKI